MNVISNLMEYAGCALMGMLGVYMVVRVASAAFFKSKQDLERIEHGTKQE